MLAQESRAVEPYQPKTGCAVKILTIVAVMECLGLFALTIWLALLLHLELWLVAIGAVVLAIAGTMTAYRVVVTAVRHQFRFSLNAMLLATTVLAVVLGTFGGKLVRMRQQQGMVAHLIASGGHVTYGDSNDTGGNGLLSRLGWTPVGTIESIQHVHEGYRRGIKAFMRRGRSTRSAPHQRKAQPVHDYH